MSYPFESPAESFRELVKPLHVLAHTDTPFREDFPTRLPTGAAYDLDKIKDRVCAYRSKNARAPLRSADALLMGEDGGELAYYFIEFKNQRVDNIQSGKDPGQNELLQKAFDSLAIVAMTFGRASAMKDIQGRSTFIVVYPEQDYSERFLEALNQCAYNRPLWGLDKLEDNGFYRKILTIHDGDFCRMALPFAALSRTSE